MDGGLHVCSGSDEVLAMSTASRQSLTLLSVVHGGVRSTRDCFSLGPEFMALVDKADIAVKDVVISWITTGTEELNQAYAADKLGQWEKVLETQPAKWTIMANVAISLTILSDLYDKCSYRKKLVLDPLFTYLNALSEWVSPEGNRFDDYEYADMCVRSLYEILGFRQ